MAANDEEKSLRSAAQQNARSVLGAHAGGDTELTAPVDSLEGRTRELAFALSMMRATLESTTDGILVTDRAGQVTSFNERFMQMWRVPRELMQAGVHRPVQEIAASQFAEPAPFLARIAEIYETWPAETFDLLELADGRIYERHSKIQRVEERSVGRVWSFRDITERRQAERELREQREWFAVTLSSIGDAVITTDIAGRITFMNPVAASMTGWPVTEALGQALEVVFNIVHEQTRQPVRNPVSRVLNEGVVVELANRTALVARDGRETAIEDSAAPIRNAAGAVTGVVMVFHDVTDRRRSEQARLQLASVVESSDDAILTKNLDGIISSWNKGAERMFGYTADEVVGRSVTVLMPPEVVNEEPGILKRLRAGERIDHYETVRRRKDGALIDISLTVSPIFDSAGRVIGASKVARDVTARKRAEAALRKSAAEFRQLADSMPQIVWTARPDGTADYFNRRWFEYSGVAEDAVGNVNMDSRIHPDDRFACRERWEAVVRTGQPFQFEVRLRDRDGNYRWHLIRAVAVRDPADEIVRWYGSSTDIHEQKHTAEALREEYTITEHLNAVSRALATELDLARIVQIITDAGTRITRAQFGAFFYNRVDEHGESYTLYGLSGVARAAFDRFPMPRATDMFGPTFRGEGVIRLDDVRKDSRFGRNAPYHGMPAGHLPVVSYLAVPVISRSGEVLGGLFFGHASAGVFTERDERIMVGIAAQAAAAMDTARLYEAEQHARNAAEQANLAKDHFLAALSHELRTPLTPVLAILSSLGEESNVPPAFAKDIATMRRNVELEARLIDDLLDLTRITRGKLELHCEQVEVDQLVENALHTCGPDFQARRLTLVRDLRCPRERIFADSARIAQILWNLLKNAVKFTPEEGTITVRSRMVPTASGPGVRIEIADTGIGIEAGRIGGIFEAFEQGGRAVTQQFGGLGLGLAISKAIAEMHRGRIVAASEGPGKGSTFTLTLPCDGGEKFPPPANESGGPAKAGGREPEKTGATAATARILLVEDHADTAAVLVRMLRRTGYDVIHADSVSAALQTAERERGGEGLDLVVSDLGLPDGSGLDMMRELSSRHGLRGIALSGFGMENDRELSMAAGFSRHLIKPVNIAVLRGAIAELLAERQAE